MAVPERSRISRMTIAKMVLPPSFRSSRATEVMTVCRSPIAATASPTRRGSSQSTQPLGLPGATAQKPQRRVHSSPRIMIVAVPRSQQWPRFGQRASSHTVTMRWRRSSALVSEYSPAPGSLILSHGGRRRNEGSPGPTPTPAPEAQPPKRGVTGSATGTAGRGAP